MDQLVNLKMLGHPVNWLITFTVLMFAGVAWAIVYEHVNTAPNSDAAV